MGGGEQGCRQLGNCKANGKWMYWLCPRDEQQHGSLTHSQATLPASRLGLPIALRSWPWPSTWADGLTSIDFFHTKLCHCWSALDHHGHRFQCPGGLCRCSVGHSAAPNTSMIRQPGPATTWAATLEGKLAFPKPFNPLQAIENQQIFSQLSQSLNGGSNILKTLCGHVKQNPPARFDCQVANLPVLL